MCILKKVILPVGIIAALGVSAIAQTYPDSVSIFTDAKSYVASKLLVGNGIFITDTVTGDAYEGKRCIKYSYDLAGMYWDAFGVTLKPVSATGTTAIRMAYKGPSGGPTMNLTITDRAGGSSAFSGLMESPDWLVSDYPLTDFTSGVDSITGNPKPADFSKISSIRFDIMSGASTGTGEVYVDNIWFMGGTLSGIRNNLNAPKALEKQLVTRSNGTVVYTVSSLDGRIISRIDQKVTANQTVSMSPTFDNQLPAGMYALTIKGAGINVSRQMVK